MTPRPSGSKTEGIAAPGSATAVLVGAARDADLRVVDHALCPGWHGGGCRCSRGWVASTAAWVRRCMPSLLSGRETWLLTVFSARNMRAHGRTEASQRPVTADTPISL
jgi:hypothetical protein